MTNPNDIPEINEDVTAALSFALRDENEKSTKMIASLEEGTYTPEILIEGIEDIMKNDAFKDLGLVLIASKDVLPSTPSAPSNMRRNLAALATVSALSLAVGSYVINDRPESSLTNASPEANIINDEKVLVQRAQIGFLAVKSTDTKSNIKPNSVTPVKADSSVTLQIPHIKRVSPRKRQSDNTSTKSSQPTEKPVATPRTISPKPTVSPTPVPKRTYAHGIPGRTYGPRSTASPTPSPSKAPTTTSPKPSPSPTRTTTTTKPSPSPTRTAAP